MGRVNFDGIIKELDTGKKEDIWDILKAELIDSGMSDKEAESLMNSVLAENAQLFFAAQFLGDTSYQPSLETSQKEYILDCFNKFVAYAKHLASDDDLIN